MSVSHLPSMTLARATVITSRLLQLINCYDQRPAGDPLSRDACTFNFAVSRQLVEERLAWLAFGDEDLARDVIYDNAERVKAMDGCFPTNGHAIADYFDNSQLWH